MIKIIPPSPFVRLMHNKPASASGSQRYITYSISEDVEEGKLLYNVLTKEMVVIEHGEENEQATWEYLRKGLFVVDTESDDMALAKKVRSFAKAMARIPSYYKKYTIFTTTKCNAQCYYCFEKEYKGIDMPDGIAKKLANVIIANYSKAIATDRKATMQLDWFGGEPLVCQRPIDTITSILRDEGVVFKSRVTSNGLLFDKETIKKAYTEWNVTEVQITLDGTENVYNRTKRYVLNDKSTNPYRIVLQNIDSMLSAGIKVVIRINIGLHNIEDAKALCCELHSKIGKRDGLEVYSTRLLEKCESYERLSPKDSCETLDLNNVQISNLLRELGYVHAKSTILHRINTHKCMADDDSTITIYPNGELCKCEHYRKDEVIGHIDDINALDNSRINLYKEERGEDCICKDCMCFPNCYRLKRCFYDTSCNKIRKQQQKNNLERMIRGEYKLWKARKSQKR